MYETELITRWLKIADKRIANLSDQEIESKVELLTSLGYVYNPYFKEFRNYFSDKGFKSIAVYNLNENQIVEMDKTLELRALEQNGRLWTIEDIGEQLNNDKENQTWVLIKLLTAPFSIFLFIGSILALIYVNIETAATLEFFTFIFLIHFISKNATISEIEGKSNTGSWWQKYELGLYIFGTVNMLYSVYITYLLTDSYWLPILIVLVLWSFVARFATKTAGKEYYRIQGFSKAYDYAKYHNDDH